MASFLRDIDRIDTGTFADFMFVHGTSSIYVDAFGRIGVHTTTPQCDLHVAGAYSMDLSNGASTQRPTTPDLAALRMGTSPAPTSLEIYDGSAWRRFRPDISKNPWGRLASVVQLTGTSVTIPLVGFRFVRMYLFGIENSGSVEISMRVGGTEVTGGYVTGIYGTTGDGSRLSRFYTATGLVRARLLDGTTFRASVAHPFSAVVHVPNLQAGQSNVPTQIFHTGFAFDQPTSAPVAIHWGITVTPSLSAAADGIILTAPSGFTAGTAMVFTWP